MFSADQRKEKLINILKDYRDLAQQNPQKLRQLIPSKEVWRFFIDGVKQEKTRGLAKLLPDLLKNLNLTLQDKMPQNEKQMAIKRLLTLTSSELNADQEKQFTFADLMALDKAWLAFEQSEPGYLQALYHGFAKIFESTTLNKESFLGIIKELHKAALTNVQKTNYADPILKPTLGEFKSDALATFRLTRYSTTANGIKEILQKKMQGKSYLSFQLENKENFISLLTFQDNEIADKVFKNKEDKERFFKLRAIQDGDQIAQELYKLIMDPTLTYLSINLTNYLTKTEVEQKLLESFEQFNKDIKDPQPFKKLLAIVTLVQDCEQLHPFIDGNIRVFCMLFLNELLMEHGFPPVILDNPNRFDAYSKSELLDEVLQGMENTMTLIKEKKLNNIETDEVLKFLTSDSKFASQLKYFEETIAIEENNRQLLNKKPEII